MSSLYYEMRDAKVNIAMELSNRGWEILGFKENESDSMTDYYSPANWGGVATKNGFTLCIDTPYEAKRVPIKKYNYGNCLSQSDLNKIEKLQAMTVERGCTESEESNAYSMIEKIKNSSSEAETEEITGYTTAHMANPGKCKWHIEKDGAIFDKGTGISKYSKIPESYRFDINTMKYKDSYQYYTDYEWIDGENVPTRKERTLSDEETKVINDFKALILRWERTVNSMNGMSDGTTENKQHAQEQQQNEKMEKVTEKVTKKVLKMVEVTDRKNIKVGDYLGFSHRGGYWKVTSEHMQKGTWKGITESRNAFDYERVGTSSRGYQQLKNTQRYYQYEYQLSQSIEKGNTKIYELKEVEEVTEVEKWVRVKPQTTAKKENTYKKEEKETKKADSSLTETEPQHLQNENIGECTIITDVDTRDNSPLWVVKLVNKVDREEYKKINSYVKSIGGYYSSFKHGFIFKTDPTNILNPITETVTEQQEENPYNPTFKEGYIYNVHFKQWNMTITELKQELASLCLPYEEINNKIAVNELTYEQVLQIKALNDKNGSILFKDAQYLESDVNIIKQLLDTSTTIIDMLHLEKMEYINNIEYKQALTSYLINSKIKISMAMFQYLHDEGYAEFERVLKDLLNNKNSNFELNTAKTVTPENIENNNNSNEKVVDEPVTNINYSKLIDKINKQIESNDKQIEKLSGNYQTNTWKRMNEQTTRDNKRYKIEADNKLLNYLLTQCNSKAITDLEQNLVIGAFRNELHSYYRRYTMDKNITSYRPIEYPQIKNDYPKDGWYNLEVPKMQKRLNKAEIFNTEQLIKAIEEYKSIIEHVERGNTIDLKAEQIKKLEREYKMQQKGDINFTSNNNLLDTLMNYADIKSNDKILEPSAGIGYIADRLKEYNDNIDVCEYNYSYTELLKLKGYNVLENDFLKLDKYNTYDKIVMNPPFSNNQDIKHIRHAYNMLNSDGKLVAICSHHWTFANDKESQNFRSWIEQLDYEVYDVPEKSFEFTNVNCKIVVINKNENDIEKAI